MQDDKYLDVKQVAARYQVGRATPWRWARESDFPAPVKLSASVTRWRLADLQEWERAREVA